MDKLFIGLVIILFFLLLFLVFRKKRKVNNKREVTSSNETISVEKKKKGIIKELEITVIGTQENAKRTSRSRQMILMDMSSYDGVVLEKEGNNIWVLNESGYDIGYLSKEDRDLLLPYIENAEYSIETGVERFFRNEQGENLIIYVTVLGFI